MVRQDSRKLKCTGGTVGPLSHASVRVKVEESGRPICGRDVKVSAGLPGWKPFLQHWVPGCFLS